MIPGIEQSVPGWVLASIVVAMATAGCGGDPEGEPVAEAEASYDSATVTVGNESALRQLVAPDARVTRLATDMEFLEGPVWFDADGGYLVFSDVVANEMKRWDASGTVRTFRSPSGPSNGNTRDAEGRLVTAQHDGRVTRTESDGSVVTLAQTYEGAQLNSPNDVVVRADESIWFTDPTYGLGDRPEVAPGRYVYRLDPETGELTAAITDMIQPNGLCFSADGSTLYVAETDRDTRGIRAYPVAADGTVGAGREFAHVEPGTPDGIRCDELGNVWSSAGDGVQIFSPTGELIGRILVPESPANLTFGGPDGHTLFITARRSLYSIPVLVTAARPS